MLGRPLRAGDRLPLGQGDLSLAGRRWPAAARPIYAARPVLRYLPGPHAFAPGLRRRFHAAAWQVSPQSNRMGFRLSGPALPAPDQTLASLGVVPGAIQLPPDGAPIVLLADAQTTGGYPLLGAVIGADLPVLAQTLPGDQVRFSTISLAAAEQAWRDQARLLVAPFEDEPQWGVAC
jgi:allophanate hydrolase subunit 2